MAPLFLLILLSLSFHHQQLQVLALANRSQHDFGYMKSVYDANEMPLKGQYDYIVIGGGTAGCPLGATLSEKYSVLVLERGDAPNAHPSVFTTSGFFANLNREDDGTTPAQRFTSEDGVQSLRGRVLGGSSMLNAGFYSRADDEFLAQSGIEWDVDLMERAYEWVEETIVYRPRVDVWQSSVRESLLEVGLVPDNGFTVRHKIGTKTSGSTFDPFGTRHGAVELLNRANLENLRVAVNATVNRIIFSTKASTPAAIGVIYTDSKGKSHVALVRRKGEIILSAGAIGSPQLLLLSGIGPRSYLSSLHINPILHSQPNVGKFMADNPGVTINLILPNSTERLPTKITGITSDYIIQTTTSSVQPNVTTNLSLGLISEKIPGPLSSGSLRLASSNNVKVAPRVRFNYFANPIDLSRCVMAMKKVGDMLKSNALDRFKHKGSDGKREFLFYGPSLPMNNHSNDDSLIESFCRTRVSTFWHYHGGCVVGKVVDSDFRVKGITSLRVVDGSTFNISPGTNPQATLMMLGRYVGLNMMRKRTESS
ncbi:(R)-mandelonitrile lyase 3-like [Humulus lupulus]|uniref:(R)-mandelonitrile lyase 3-like n=1 Tax=Humulus lupulus TaxID=3486 RepID=UPI002B417816|nr:(R)-mandelonitrile lyase 3-like [Humulus lupulus]